MTRFLEPTRERFLLAIAATLPAERFIELHFFAPIRQGGVESGVAVIAAHPERVPVEEPSVILSEAKDLLFADEKQHPLTRVPVRRFAPQDDREGAAPHDDSPRRYTIYSAKYRLVLKGADRGKGECSVIAEADAPLVTVEMVVRGVQRRSGDDEGPERMSGDDARDYVLAATR